MAANAANEAKNKKTSSTRSRHTRLRSVVHGCLAARGLRDVGGPNHGAAHIRIHHYDRWFTRHVTFHLILLFQG